MTYEVREIPFAPGYFVSTRGEVFSERIPGPGKDRRGPRRAMKLGRDKDGYPVASFRPGSERKVNFTVHRIVATVFLGQRPTEQHEVRHLDGNRLNADVSNLAWGTHLENAKGFV